MKQKRICTNLALTSHHWKKEWLEVARESALKDNTFQLYTFILYQLSDVCTPVNWVDRIQAISFELMMKIDFVSAINIKTYHYPFSPESFNECLHVLTVCGIT